MVAVSNYSQMIIAVGAVSLQMPDTVNESIGSFSINFSLNATASKDIVLTVNISSTGIYNIIYMCLGYLNVLFYSWGR